MRGLLIGLAGLFVLWAELRWFGLAIDIILIVAAVAFTTGWSPTKDCACCGGRRVHRDWLIPWAKHRCRTCYGTGSTIRWSTATFRPELARQIRAQRPPKRNY